MRRAGLAHADREGPRVQLRHRASCSTRCATKRSARGDAARNGDQVRRVPPRFVQHGVKIGLLNEALPQYDMKALGAAFKARARPAVRLPRPAETPLRPLLVDQYVGGRRFELQYFFCASRWGSR